MTEPKDLDSLDPSTLPLAREELRQGVSLIWLLPVVAALIGIWLAYQVISGRGPEITISFETAQGMVAGKTRIKHKSVDLGLVTRVALDPAGEKVLVDAELSPGNEALLTSGTRFWVVRPRLSLKGVSGLSTLVEGAYIEIDPGAGAPKSRFVGLEDPPVVRAGVSGTRYILLADTLGSLTVGSPVYYRDIPVGEVLRYELTEDNRQVRIHVFVQSPYHWLVRDNSRFWKVSGVDVSLDADGVRVKAESLSKLLLGGVAFESPDSLGDGQPAAEETTFALYADERAVEEGNFTTSIPLVMYFDGSVRGLKVGAPVEFRGIQVGKVSDIRLEFDSRTTTFRIPVLARLQPQRVSDIQNVGQQGAVDHLELFRTLMHKGLRARLATGSLITGQLFVELDLHPGTELRLVGHDRYLELPTIPTSLDVLTASVSHVLAKIESLPLEAIGKEVLGLVSGLNRTANAPEILETVRTLNQTLKEIGILIPHVDRQVEPLTRELTAGATAARGSLEELEKAMQTLQAVIGPQTPLYYQMLEATRELSETSRALRDVLELMERNPESILFGKPNP
ncbi:MAG: MlaD family protein [Magnetococcus sp. WYHC-3]